MAEGTGSRLDSWKEIATYLGRDVTTAIRWEKTRGLPVHRVPGGKRKAVFAFTAEVDRWLRGGAARSPMPPDPTDAQAPAPRPGRAPTARPRRYLVLALTSASAIGFGLGGAIIGGRARGASGPPGLPTLMVDDGSEPGTVGLGGRQGDAFSIEGSGFVAATEGDLKTLVTITVSREGEELQSVWVESDREGRLHWVFQTNCLTPPGCYSILAEAGDSRAPSRLLRSNRVYANLAGSSHCDPSAGSTMFEGATTGKSLRGDPVELHVYFDLKGDVVTIFNFDLRVEGGPPGLDADCTTRGSGFGNAQVENQRFSGGWTTGQFSLDVSGVFLSPDVAAGILSFGPGSDPESRHHWREDRCGRGTIPWTAGAHR